MAWIVAGDFIVLTLHIAAFFTCRAAGVEGWWLAVAPVSIIVVAWVTASIRGLMDAGNDMSAVDTLLTLAIVTIFFPGTVLEVIVCGDASDPEDLKGSSVDSQMLAASLLPIVAFYLLVLLATFPEGTAAVSSVLWAFVMLGLQLVPLAGHYGVEGPKEMQAVEKARPAAQ